MHLIHPIPPSIPAIGTRFLRDWHFQFERLVIWGTGRAFIPQIEPLPESDANYTRYVGFWTPKVIAPCHFVLMYPVCEAGYVRFRRWISRGRSEWAFGWVWTQYVLRRFPREESRQGPGKCPRFFGSLFLDSADLAKGTTLPEQNFRWKKSKNRSKKFRLQIWGRFIFSGGCGKRTTPEADTAF